MQCSSSRVPWGVTKSFKQLHFTNVVCLPKACKQTLMFKSSLLQPKSKFAALSNLMWWQILCGSFVLILLICILCTNFIRKELSGFFQRLDLVYCPSLRLTNKNKNNINYWFNNFVHNVVTYQHQTWHTTNGKKLYISCSVQWKWVHQRQQSGTLEKYSQRHMHI